MVGGSSEIGRSALRLLVVACVAAAAAGAMAWMLLSQQQPSRDREADRRALEIRAQELTAHALAPGSPLACLDAVAGDSVDAACEKALFASPSTVAAASAYAAARLELLSEMDAYVKGGGADIDGMRRPLRRSLETDAFGFLAHALAVRDACTSQNCKALDALRDASRVRANLSGQTLERYLDRYATAWAQTPDTSVPVADAGATGQQATAGQPGAPGQRKVVVNIDFPTAASIPAVSIMNPEPGTKPSSPAGAAAAATAAPAAAAPAKRTRKQATNNPPAQAAAPSPPAETLSPAGQADPVWAPAPQAAPAPPAQAAAPSNAPAANFAAGGTAPLPLAPSPR
jgi:hypothetical protein